MNAFCGSTKYTNVIGNNSAWSAPLWDLKTYLFKSARISFKCGCCDKFNENRKFFTRSVATSVCSRCGELNFFPKYSKPGRIVLAIGF